MEGDQLHKKLEEYASQVSKRQSSVTDEDKAKLYLIMPFFSDVLGWDCNDPHQFVPEFSPALAKAGECVDYALIDLNGNAVIFIEAKGPGIRLDNQFKQLNRYVCLQPTVRFGVITNGCEYLWYNGDNRSNYLKPKSFLKFDALNPHPNDAKFLSAFVKKDFHSDQAQQKLREVLFETQLLNWMEKNRKDPSDRFVKFLVNELKNSPFQLDLPQINQQNIGNYRQRVVSFFNQFNRDRQIDTAEQRPGGDEQYSKGTKSVQLTDANQLLECRLKSGETLNITLTNRRAYWFEHPGYIGCKDSQSTFLTLLSLFASSYPLGSDRFVARLCENFGAFSLDQHSTRFNRTEIGGQELWVTHCRNEVKKNVIFKVAKWFNPPLVEGQNYGLWLPEGKPKKHR